MQLIVIALGGVCGGLLGLLGTLAEFLQVPVQIRAHGGGNAKAIIFIISGSDNPGRAFQRACAKEIRLHLGIRDIYGHSRAHRGLVAHGKTTGFGEGEALLLRKQMEVDPILYDLCFGLPIFLNLLAVFIQHGHFFFG